MLHSTGNLKKEAKEMTCYFYQGCVGNSQDCLTFLQEDLADINQSMQDVAEIIKDHTDILVERLGELKKRKQEALTNLAETCARLKKIEYDRVELGGVYKSYKEIYEERVEFIISDLKDIDEYINDALADCNEQIEICNENLDELKIKQAHTLSQIQEAQKCLNS